MTRPYKSVNDDGTISRSKVTPYTPCGKYGYSSRKVAKQTAAEESKETGKDLQAYKCPRGCHAWHIGHPRGARPERWYPKVHQGVEVPTYGPGGIFVVLEIYPHRVKLRSPNGLDTWRDMSEIVPEGGWPDE